MNLKDRFLEISEFLRRYEDIWQKEILLLYPDPLKDYPAPWIADLKRFKSREDILRLERKQVEGLIEDPALKAFYARMKELIEVVPAPQTPPMPYDSFTFLHMIPKKQYEIKTLAPLINKLYQDHNISEVIDIGGGIGHFAQTLVNQYDLNVCSVDMDPLLQKTGLNRHKKMPKTRRLVRYETVKVDVGSARFSQLLTSESMTVGLHTCGGLAVAQIKASTEKARAVVSLGCCYHKMEDRPDLQNISQFASANHPLQFSRYALTLASRAHLKLEDKDFDLKLKVKYYRYAIHFLLVDHYGMKDFVSFGKSSPKLYKESFGAYALEQFSRIKLDSKHSKEELDAFFADPKLQDTIAGMLAAGIIRDAMGRLLELYILLDRAIFLEEQNFKAKLYQCFDELISPRNLGIFATSSG